MTSREFATTADMADGQPLPPYIENGIPWRVVCRIAGHTIWSRRPTPTPTCLSGVTAEPVIFHDTMPMKGT